jgi:2-polyprenyl-3-methyl-5-hydroxy-6-metoxy-1,4-benzoquinol methylase
MSLGFDATYADWKAWDAAAFGRYSRVDARYFAAEMETSPAARVLEIGFGNGSLLAWLKDSGAEAHGVEANPVLIERATRLLGADRVFPDLQDPRLRPCTFTHVIALDVLEHVPMSELEGMLERVRDLLVPAGTAVLRFPNGDSPFGRINQHGDPTHVTTLGGERLTYFARRVGLEVQALRAPALPVRSVGLVKGLRRLLIHGARWVIERLVSSIYLNGRRIPLDPNYTAILRRPPDVAIAVPTAPSAHAAAHQAGAA